MESQRNWVRYKSMLLIHRVFAFVAPAIWRALVTITLNGLPATLPQSLILRPILPPTPPPRTPSNAFNYRAFVVMRNGTAPIPVLDLNILLVASHTMELWGWVQIRKEIRDGRERRVGRVVF